MAALQLPELPKHLQRVEKNLASVMRSDALILDEPLARLRSVHGKRIRPALVIAAASSIGKVNDSTISAATAIELLHIASLVHDDILDQSSVRWNQATIVRKEGARIALMTGDFLIASAFEQASLAGQEAARCLSKSFTVLCRGQALEMESEHDLNRTTIQYFQSIQGKTATLFAASCFLGALSAKASQPELIAIEEFGQHFGIGFSIVDDLIDLLSNSAKAGKPTGNDLPGGIYTLPFLIALQSAFGPEIRRLIKDQDFAAASKLIRTSGACESALAEATKYFKNAEKALRITNYPELERFGNFVDSFLKWTMIRHFKDTKLS